MYNQAWAFDLDGWKWFHLGLFFLPKNALIVASSKGLVCLGKKSREEYILYVCNPITKMWRQLPALTFDPDIVLLDVDLGTNIYKVAALVLRDNHCSRRPSGTVSVFDSSSNIWVETDEVPVSISSMRVMDASLVGRYLCCLLPEGLVFFDLDERRWIVNNRAYRFVTGDHLDLGYLFVFNRAGKWNVWQHFADHCIHIHEYDMDSRQWRRVSQAETVIAYVGHYSSLTQFGSEEELQGNARHSPKKRGGFSISSTVSDFPKSPLLCDRVKINAGFHIKRLWFKPYIGATP
ncbi:hypothetical protein KP509_06G004500 [Ceratopteris richardii]|nr:hypothetical protein KP509_06G004500 [Ceratopteris richardii]